MSERSQARPVIERLLWLVGLIAYLLILAALAKAQTERPLFPSSCVTLTWRPLRAVPWLFAALLPMSARAATEAIASALEKRRAAKLIVLGDGPYRQSTRSDLLDLDRPRGRGRMLVPLLTAVSLLAGARSSLQKSCPYGVPASCRPTVTTITLVPTGLHAGTSEMQEVERLAQHFRDCYRLPVEVAKGIEPPGSAWNATRRQWIAESILKQLPCSIVDDPLCTDRRDRLFIGVTTEDIYSSQEAWRYVFSSRDTERRVAIVSLARMGGHGGTSWSAHARKMIAKVIALEYCALPASNDPQSVRFNRIDGPGALDGIDESRW